MANISYSKFKPIPSSRFKVLGQSTNFQNIETIKWLKVRFRVVKYSIDRIVTKMFPIETFGLVSYSTCVNLLTRFLKTALFKSSDHGTLNRDYQKTLQVLRSANFEEK